MEPIKPKQGPALEKDSTGKHRMMVRLPDGRHMAEARLIMINFLHTKSIPKRLHVHHKNGVCNDNRLENLELLLTNDHNKVHHPRDNSRFGVSCSDDPKAYGHLYWKECRSKKPNLSKNNPEWVASKNAHAKRYRAYKKATDPTYLEHRRELMNNYYNSHKDDPMFRKKKNEYNKMRTLKKKLEACNEII